MGVSIAVASGKGGVGKTQTTINLGTSLALRGKKVIVVDGNIPTPDIALYLGIQNTKTLNDVLSWKAKPEDAVYKIEETGLHVMPASVRLNAVTGFSEKGFYSLVQKLKKSYDFVLVDSAPGLDLSVINLIKQADKLLLVTNPELVSLADTYKTAAISETLGKELQGIIINRVNRFNGEVRNQEISVLLDKRAVIGRVPEDTSLPMAAMNSEPVVTSFPHSPSARAFKRIAAEMLGEKYVENAFLEHVFHILNRR